jgi:hypothetical protein
MASAIAKKLDVRTGVEHDVSENTRRLLLRFC